MTSPRNSNRRSVRLACVLAAVATLGWAGSAAAADHARTFTPRPADPGPGQTERIRFASGTDNATVSGTFTPGSDDRYVLWARAGQSMTLAGDFGGLGIGVTAPNGSPLPGGPGDSITYQLPATGDYTISIGPRRSEATTYTFTVTIPALPRDTTRRIQFAPGTDNATVQGTFREGQRDRYVLRAAAGQTMLVQLRPQETGASFGVFAPDGRELPSQPGVDFAARLPQSGDYTIVVGGGRGDSSTTYTLTVHIPAGSSGNTTRIQFAPGTNGASLRADLQPATTDRYVLRAAAGQTMVVHVAPLVHNITMSIFAPDGTPLAEDLEQATVTLPANGDYLVVVETTSSGGPYQISFWIE
jgi:hypothetical protein